jgi:hypothetical protein
VIAIAILIVDRELDFAVVEQRCVCLYNSKTPLRPILYREIDKELWEFLSSPSHAETRKSERV